MLRALLMIIGLVGTQVAAAADTYQVGRISNITVSGDVVLIMLDSGTPQNCTGAPYGWMAIPASYKPMQSLVMGLWLRGDAAQTQVTVYTSAYTGSGYCTIEQFDPVN